MGERGVGEMKWLTIFMLLSLGCYQEDLYEFVLDSYDEVERPRFAAVDAWEEMVGRVGDDCYERLQAVEVYLVSDFTDGCTVFEYQSGCYLKQARQHVDLIHVYDKQSEQNKEYTLIHEYIHLIHACEEGGFDTKHLDKRLWDRYAGDTVESTAVKNLEL
jgi:hypothetical protein